MVYFNLDRFKEINDRHGRAGGDSVLQLVSQRILDSVRHTDIAARIGGDEFVVILPGVGDRKEAARVGDLIVSAIGQSGPFEVGASFGISIYPENGIQTDVLLRTADENMYRARMGHLRAPAGSSKELVTA